MHLSYVNSFWGGNDLWEDFFFFSFSHSFKREGMRLLQSTVHHFLTRGCDKFSWGNTLIPSFPIKPDTSKSHLAVTHFAPAHTLHDSLWQQDISEPFSQCSPWQAQVLLALSCLGPEEQHRVLLRSGREPLSEESLWKIYRRKIKPLSLHGV